MKAKEEAMEVQEMIERSLGWCRGDQALRTAIEAAVREGTSEWQGAIVELLDDRSELPWNGEATYCCLVKIDGRHVVGYYSDNAQHVIDVLDGVDPASATVEDWAAYFDEDSPIVEHLMSREERI